MSTANNTPWKSILDEIHAKQKAEKDAWDAMTDEEKVFHKLKTPPKKKEEVLIPMIRHILPTVIAHQIIGVQPMTAPTGLFHTLRVNYDSGNDEMDPNQIT